MKSTPIEERGIAWVVHPDPDVRQVAREALGKEGFDVLSSGEPRGVLAAMMLGCLEPPHLIVTGSVPELTGLLACAEARDWPTHVVVVAERTPWLQRCIREGADAQLDPGCGPHALRTAVGALSPRRPIRRRRSPGRAG